MVKNGIWLGGASKQNAPFLKTFPPKNASMSLMSRIGPMLDFEGEVLNPPPKRQISTIALQNCKKLAIKHSIETHDYFRISKGPFTLQTHI